MLIKVLVVPVLALSPIVAFAQNPSPSWEDLAIAAQKNATTNHVVDTAIISALKEDIANLRAELAKRDDAKQAEPPK